MSKEKPGVSEEESIGEKERRAGRARRGEA
jgi:hypothetical protein